MTKKTCCKLCSNQKCCPNPEKLCEPYDGCEEECEGEECFAFNDQPISWQKLSESLNEGTFISLAGVKKCGCGYEIFQTLFIEPKAKVKDQYDLQCMNCGDQWRIKLEENNIISWANLDELEKEEKKKKKDSDYLVEFQSDGSIVKHYKGGKEEKLSQKEIIEDMKKMDQIFPEDISFNTADALEQEVPCDFNFAGKKFTSTANYVIDGIPLLDVSSVSFLMAEMEKEVKYWKSLAFQQQEKVEELRKHNAQWNMSFGELLPKLYELKKHKNKTVRDFAEQFETAYAWIEKNAKKIGIALTVDESVLNKIKLLEADFNIKSIQNTIEKAIDICWVQLCDRKITNEEEKGVNHWKTLAKQLQEKIDGEKNIGLEKLIVTDDQQRTYQEEADDSDDWKLDDDLNYEEQEMIKEKLVIFRLSELLDWFGEADSEWLQLNFKENAACISYKGIDYEPQVFAKIIDAPEMLKIIWRNS